MKLSIQEAAIRAGKTERQVRYMIRQGRLTAEKEGGRWVIDAAQIPDDDVARERRARREGRLRDAVDQALFEKGRPARYSVRDLKAFQIAKPLLLELSGSLGEGHPVLLQLRQLLEQLTIGCHRYAGKDKAAAYGAARDAASRAVCELLLDPGQDRSKAVDTLEQELMPAIAGLLRRVERTRERD